MIIRWDEDKNIRLKKIRGISFEQVVDKIADNDILDIRKHYNDVKYPDQYVFIIEFNNYAFVVPYDINNNDEIILKTIIPSRKETARYLR